MVGEAGGIDFASRSFSFPFVRSKKLSRSRSSFFFFHHQRITENKKKINFIRVQKKVEKFDPHMHVGDERPWSVCVFY